MVLLMTVRAAAEECGISEYMLRNWVKQGKCPGMYSGNRFLVNVKQLEKKIQEECSIKE